MLHLSIFVLLIWLYLFLFHAGFWQVSRFRLPSEGSKHNRLVAVIIPARNEGDVISRALTSLLKQNFAGKFHIFVVDDRSTDCTAEAARRAAENVGALPQLTVIPGAEPPGGWTGKVWAMHQGWLVASLIRPDYLVLTDADIEHPPDNLARLIELAERRGDDLVSVMVKLPCDTLAEKLLVPAFVYFFFLLYPPPRIADSRSRIAGAAGGCVLLRPEALEKAGGFEAIRGEIIDDCSLAAAVKRSGGRLWLGVSDDTRSLRGYLGCGALRNMIARTAFNQLRHSALLLAACVSGMLLTFAIPLALVWAENKTVGRIAVITCLLMFTTYVPVLRLYRTNVLSAVTLPFAALFYLYATVYSAIKYWGGEGGQWKGRAQDPLS